jgi:hypothetical protein
MDGHRQCVSTHGRLPTGQDKGVVIVRFDKRVVHVKLDTGKDVVSERVDNRLHFEGWCLGQINDHSVRQATQVLIGGGIAENHIVETSGGGFQPLSVRTGSEQPQGTQQLEKHDEAIFWISWPLVEWKNCEVM